MAINSEGADCTGWEPIQIHAHIDMLGHVPDFIRDDDPRSAAEQINERYAHGGGWRPLNGFIWRPPDLYFPGDPAYRPLFSRRLRDEEIILFTHEWVAIFQPDGSFKVARID